MVRSGRRLLLPALLLVAHSARAHDPDMQWYTLETPHFAIHYHQGAHRLALRAAELAEMALIRLAGALEHVPAERIELVVSDEVDYANGTAQVVPYNIINLLATAPENLSVLSDFDDYHWILLVHELTHILHMDTVSGVPAWLNRIFGRWLYPNGAQPTWFTEGLATHMESRFSSAGRIRSSQSRMYLRTAALAGTIPELDRLSGTTKSWPQGTTPYLFGSFFLDYVARRFGESVLSDLSHRMSGMLLPWSLNLVARHETGWDYPTLYQDWKDSVLREAQEKARKVESEGRTPVRLLTRRGQYQWSPRVSPGGSQILYYSDAVDRWPVLRLVGRDGGGDRPLFEVNGESSAAFTRDGGRIVFSQAEVVDQHYFFYDLFVHDLATGNTRPLTRGQRALAPDVSPDGESVVYVHNKLGRTQLALIGLQDAEPVALTSFDDGTQVYSPRFSPDGRQVVFSATAPGGGRSIRLLDLGDRSISSLTDGHFMDIDPAFSADGKRVVFSSDRTGIFNVYSIDPATRDLERLTNLLTGGFAPDPAPDGSGIAFSVYGQDGYDIAWLDLPLARHDPTPTRDPRPTPPELPQAATVVAAEGAASEPYRPWRTLLPRSWLPLFGEDLWGSTYGVLFGGADVLGKVAYDVALSYGPAMDQLYLDLGISAQVLYPTLTFYGARRVNRYFRQAIVNGRSFPVDKQEVELYFDAAFPVFKVQSSHVIFFNYDLSLFDRWSSVPSDPMGLEPVLPDDGNLAWFSLGWAFSNVRSFISSISAEEGLSATISLRYSHPALGSGSQIAEARFWLRSYFPVLRDRHHVLALALQGGMAVGDPRRKNIYAIGGLPLRDPVQDTLFGYRYGGVYLRGYPPSAFWGSLFLLGSAEYRLPIVFIEKGFLSLPIFLRQLHAAVFVDLGGTGVDTLSGEMLKLGVGTELRLDFLFAYHLASTLRLGYGRGISSGGENNFYLTVGWGF